jgi:hypothetical protein
MTMDFYGCRRLGPDEIVEECDGYTMGSVYTLFSVPFNWIGRCAKDCDYFVYRSVAQ